MRKKPTTPRHITLLAQMLRDALFLAAGMGGHGEIPLYHRVRDLVSLTATGELLRRAVLLEEVTNYGVRDVLEAYEDHLTGVDASLTPPSLADDLTRALDALQFFADTPSHARLLEDGEGCLEGIDEVLNVTAALHRAGCVSEEQRDAMGVTAYQAVRSLVGRLPELCQVAEDYLLTFPPVRDHGATFAFWEPLAEFAPSRRALRALVCEPSVEVRDAIIDGILDRLE